MEEIKQSISNNTNIIECIQTDQNSILVKLNNLQKLLNKFENINLFKPHIIYINCKNLREERQIDNNNIVLTYLYKKNIRALRDNCNQKELNRVLSQLNMTDEELVCKCDDKYFATLLSGRISINASRQGTKDEEYVLFKCNITSSSVGIYITKLSNNEYRPSREGKIIELPEYKKMKKCECLKSFDGKISGKVNGWIFAKITFSSGGHQDNVFDEAHQMCRWVVKHGENDLLFVILIDTDLKKQFDELKNNYNDPKLLITNHIGLQEYFIDNF
jgi:hypothetical protein